MTLFSQKIFGLGTASALALSVACVSSVEAATCGAVGADFTCTALDSDPVSSATSGASVTVVTGASVISNDENVTPISLTGGASTIANAGRIEQTDTGNGGYAITGAGTGLTITNSGTIASGDRGIEMLSGSGLSVTNELGGAILSRRQGIRSGVGVTGAFVRNDGIINATDGRALQLRGEGATVINTGIITGGEEVIEARGNFSLTNSGTIQINSPTIPDEDGVQFASGVVDNNGLIEGTDDGIDMDEGVVFNGIGGTIRSLAPDFADNSGIDIDEEFDDGIITRQNTSVQIVNAGVIEGPSAIGADPSATNEVIVTNSGTLLGRGGTAIRLAPGQGDSALILDGASQIFGDVLFGAGADVVSLFAMSSGQLIDGDFNGGLGMDTVDFSSAVYDLLDIVSFSVSGDIVDLSLDTDGGVVAGRFISFETWFVGGVEYTASALAAAVNPPAIPLPAGLPLLLGGLGTLALLRRRARKV